MQQNLPFTEETGTTARNSQTRFSGNSFLWRHSIAFMLALAGIVFTLKTQAQSVVIGATSGTGSTYFGPVYNFGGSSTTDNSRHAYLYTAAELGIPTGAVITEIAWLKADAGQVTGANTFNLLLKNTTDASLAAGTTWGTVTTGATTVYTSAAQTISGAANTYLAFPVSNFTYTGNNLQIMTDWVRATNPGDAVTFYPNTAAGKAIGTASTATLTATSTLNTTTYGNSRPTIRITYVAGSDLGVTGILPTGSVPSGTSQTIMATIKNFGNCAVSGFTVNWTVDGVAQPVFNGTGVLAPQATINGVIGNFTFTPGGHVITATITTPGGTCGPDLNTSNNTFSVNINACNRTAPLNGTYTIMNTAPTSATNFSTFTEAADALNGCGVSGPVTFNVVSFSGPYREQVTLLNIPGASATNTITFNGNGNTLTANPTAANPALIKFDNADYVRFNNLNITVDPAATVGWGVQLINGSDFATISSCTITIPLVSGSNLNGIVAGTSPGSAGAGDHTNNSTFENNTIIGGAYGISINGLVSNLAQNNRITGNTIKDCDSYMIYLNNVDGTLVEGNDISRPTRTTTNNFQGIYMVGTNKNNIFNKNRIHNTGSLATAAYGINFRTGVALAGQENLVKNNLIYDFQNTGNTYGIVNVGNDGINYYHNTIYFSKTTLSATAVVQGFHQNDAVNNVSFLNNIVVIDVPGSSTNLKHALYFNQPASVITSNRNVLYVSPATNNGHTGYHSATNYTILANWQNANSRVFDQNSINDQPNFANLPNGNLTPTNLALNNIGRITIPAVTDDFDGGPARSAGVPDPGAYEFGPTATPLSGFYTINKAVATGGTNFQSFQDATQQLNVGGISGPVIFNVVPGSGPYNEKVEFLATTGVNATNSVTFYGHGNIITTTTVNGAAVILLNGAKYYHLDSLTINVIPANSSVGGIGINLVNAADHNIINRCIINLPLTSTNGNLLGIMASNGLTTRGNHTNYSVFSNNTINGGYYGILINGATGGLTAVGNQIINNRIRDTYFYNINLNDADGTVIANNDISRPTRTGVPTFYGIFFGQTTMNSVVRGNKIYHTNGGTSAYGIYSSATSAPVGSENLFYNNLIYDFSNSGTTYAIYNSGSDGHYYYYNTIDLNNTANTGDVRGFFQTTAASNIEFKNNIISINCGNSGTNHALYFASTNSSISSNNNILHVIPGTTNHYVGHFSTNQTTLADWRMVNSGAYDQNSISADPMFAFQAIGYLKPTNSVIYGTGVPITAVSSDILDCTRSTTTPNPGVFECIYNSMDVGITGIISPNSGCEPYSSITNSFIVSIYNYGTSPVSNIPISIAVNNGAPVMLYMPGPFAPGASGTIVTHHLFGVNMVASGTYNLRVCTLLPGDMDPTNDCYSKMVTNSRLTGPINIDFETTTSGLNFLKKVTNRNSSLEEAPAASFGTGTKGLIMAGKAVATWISPVHTSTPWMSNPAHLSSISFCFEPNSCNPTDSLFLFFDLKQLYKGANINTNFRVKVNGQQVGPTYNPPFSGTPITWQALKVDLTPFKNLANIEIEMESLVSEEFANGTGPANLVDNIRVVCKAGGLSIKDNLLQSRMHVFPNPSNGTFTIDLPQGKTYELTITDLTGRVIKQISATGGSAQVDLGFAAKGIYLLQVNGEKGTAVQKLIIE